MFAAPVNVADGTDVFVGATSDSVEVTTGVIDLVTDICMVVATLEMLMVVGAMAGCVVMATGVVEGAGAGVPVGA